MFIYEIESGDTIYNIAKEYKTTIEAIAEVNNIDPNDTLVIGQSITIPVDKIVYQVKSGDTVYSIAKRYGVSINDLYLANPNLNNNSLIFPGQQIVIPYQNIKVYDGVVNGYVLPGISTDILNMTLPYLDYLTIFSYEVLPNGELRNLNDETYLVQAKQRGVKPLMAITNIGGEGFSSEVAHELLTSNENKQNLIENILQILSDKGYYGVNVDFEYLFPEDKDLYTDFLNELTTVLHQSGYTIAVAVAPKTSSSQQGVLYEAHDYRAIGEIVDIVIIMTYEWGYLYGDPQPISPINKIRDVISYAVTEIPADKILLGVSNYAYDWTLPYIKGQPAQILSNKQALSLARNKGSNILFDINSQSPYFRYFTTNNQHIVWFEDVRSLNAKLRLSEEFGLLGISYWNINYYINPSGLLEIKN